MKQPTHHLSGLFTLTLLFFGFLAYGQEYDILIKNGHVIDPKNNIDDVRDVAIADGKIIEVGPNIPASQARKVIDAKGLYVSPGLVDIHTHVFWGTKPNAYLSNSFSSLPPDGFTFRVGVTTVVDVGGAGWRNFETFKAQTIDVSKTRVLAFLNIVGHGMSGGPYEQDLTDMNGKLTAMKAAQYRSDIVGIKVAHYSGSEWHPIEQAVKAGEQARLPLMIDFGGHTPQLSLERLLMEELRPGDIFTHAYADVNGRTSIVDEDGKVLPYVKKAQERGIIFDVGHGGGSFWFSQAQPAIKQGFFPNSISTDLHTGSMNAGMKDMMNVMSKFLNMGLPVADIIKYSTWNPAQEINREDFGHLSKGVEADVTIFTIKKGKFGFVDVVGEKLEGTQKFECEVTIRAGKVVYDLNGLSY
ncbi:MAG: amidohydrolase/deacetylase family metallohydrolase [Cyclobacteriaceae bacterium]|nr:amidohydrolase/deacetylase family metallohydrolase [Cyclobacteriaceae bacterium]